MFGRGAEVRGLTVTLTPTRQENEDLQPSAATRRLGSRIEKMIKSLEGDLAKVCAGHGAHGAMWH